MQTVGTRPPHHGQRLPPGRLQHEIRRGPADRRGLAAHNACHRNRAASVRYHHGVGFELDRLTIEQFELLARLGHTHDDAPIEFGQVKGVHRLPEFEHHVVGDVHHRVDGTKPAASQPLLHPEGAGPTDVYIANHPVHEARAALPRFQRNREGIFNRGRHLDDRRIGELAVGEQRHFPRHAGKAQTVGAVRRQVQLDHAIFQTQVVAKVRPHRCFRGQLHQAVAVAVVLCAEPVRGRAT